MSNSGHRSATAPRRGMLLIAVLACLTLSAMLLTYWLRLIAIERRQVRQFQTATQAELLADAALARGKLKAQADASYTGETWKPASGGPAAAEATIVVVPGSEGSETRQVNVSAEIASGTKNTVRRTRTQPISIKAEEPAS